MLIPKFKQQLIFLEEHTKLFQKINDCSISGDNELSKEFTNCRSLVAASANILTSSPAPINYQSSASSLVDSQSSASSLINAQSSASISVNSQSPSFIRTNTTQADQSTPDRTNGILFPKEYKIPVLPNELIKDIDNGKMETFGPHCTNRRILIDAISHDLFDAYKCL